jgi:hypothetical protein
MPGTSPGLSLLGSRLACHTITSPSNCLALTRPSPRLVWPCLELHLALRCIGPRLPCLASPLALPYLAVATPGLALLGPRLAFFSVLASPCLDHRIALLCIALVLELNYIALPRLSPSRASHRPSLCLSFKPLTPASLASLASALVSLALPYLSPRLDLPCLASALALLCIASAIALPFSGLRLELSCLASALHLY